MRNLILASALLLVGSAPAFAADTAAKPAKNDPNRMICKREVPIGSLIASRKTCLTAKEWQDRAVNGNEQTRRLIDDSMARNPTPSN